MRDEAAEASGGNLAENVITGQAAVIASMPFQLVGRPFSWTAGGYIFWLLQGNIALLITAAVYVTVRCGVRGDK